MLDDGHHTLDSMKQFIKLYSQIMTDDGILIIEDIQSWDWIDILKNEVPDISLPAGTSNLRISAFNVTLLNVPIILACKYDVALLKSL
jgi:hypothetical protein